MSIEEGELGGGNMKGPGGQGEIKTTTDTNIMSAVSEIEPRKIHNGSYPIGRQNIIFQKQFNKGNEFIPWSDDPKSIEFMEKYYRFTCGDPNYERFGFNSMDNIDRSTLSRKGVEHICEEIGVKKVGSLKIYPFFEDKGGGLVPTRDLICQTAFMIIESFNYPQYLAGGHLGNAEENRKYFDYYIGLLGLQGKQKSDMVELMIGFSNIAKKRPGISFLHELEVYIDEIMKIVKEKDIGPFEYYESLLREQFSFVDNITKGDEIGFKLTPTGALFLYMCNPNNY